MWHFESSLIDNIFYTLIHGTKSNSFKQIDKLKPTDVAKKNCFYAIAR